MKHVKSFFHLSLLAVVALTLAACSESLTNVDSDAAATIAKRGGGPAEGNGILNTVHGVPAATVDVCASGDVTGNDFLKIISDFDFTEIDTRELPEGNYDVKVIGATGDASCAADALPGLEVSGAFIPAGANVSAVAHLTESGDLQLSLFLNEAGSKGFSTLSAHHTAQAPPVDVWLGRDEDELTPAIEDFTNGDQVNANIRPGRHLVALSLPDDENVIFGPTELKLRPQTTYAVYAVGVFPSSFQFVILPIGH